MLGVVNVASEIVQRTKRLSMRWTWNGRKAARRSEHGGISYLSGSVCNDAMYLDLPCNGIAGRMRAPLSHVLDMHLDQTPEQKTAASHSCASGQQQDPFKMGQTKPVGIYNIIGTAVLV